MVPADDAAAPTAQSFDFSHLKQLDIEGETRWYDMPRVWPGFRLKVRCTDPTVNRTMWMGRREIVAKLEGREMPVETSDKQERRYREEDRELLPEFAIVGWENLTDGVGRPVPFSVEAGKQLLAKLPAWILDPLRKFCMEPTNFARAINFDAIAGKSPAASPGS